MPAMLFMTWDANGVADRAAPTKAASVQAVYLRIDGG